MGLWAMSLIADRFSTARSMRRRESSAEGRLVRGTGALVR
jgi:hypothetical protein